MYKKTMMELKKLLDHREISSVELIKEYLNHIQQIDSKINPYITLQEEKILFQLAQKSDQKRREGKHGILEGIPISIGDDICTKGIKTTGDSRILQSFIPPYNATAVERCIQEGAIVVGKLNIPEIGTGSFCSEIEETSFVLGSDREGELRQSAYFCGRFALKPTYGRVSRYGLMSIASSFEQIGPMTKAIDDMDLIMKMIGGVDDKDPTTFSEPWITLQKETSLQNIKMGIPIFSKDIPCDFFIQEQIQKIAKQWNALGAIVNEIDFSALAYAPLVNQILTSAEASSNTARLDGIRYGYRTPKYKSIEELYQKTRQEGLELGLKEKILFGAYVLSSSHYEDYYIKAQKLRTLLVDACKQIFQDYDVILMPVVPFEIGNKKEGKSIVTKYQKNIYTSMANITGLPAITIPTGYRLEGHPFGFQLMSSSYQEQLLLKMASVYESKILSKRK
ncbi:MAG: hypothetical protein GX347_05850 [Epulopiscium sp.]|nr:hypothetical protein [Candidatus Epulonipiscium sp.]